jgi:Chlorophyll A-B binding protein
VRPCAQFSALCIIAHARLQSPQTRSRSPCRPPPPLRHIHRYRAAELKHGRVAMAAALGVLVQTFTSLPDPVFANGGKPQTAMVELYQTRPEALWQIFLACGAAELFFLKQVCTCI